MNAADSPDTGPRSILHVDMDAFYASIEERDRPEIVGQPVVVGGNANGRGVVCAANYLARPYGVHSAMPTRTALRLCPHAVVLPPDMSKYAAVSREISEVFHRFTPLVEPLSLDEAFLDVTGSRGLFGDGPEIARRVKEAILDRTSLVASVGVAPNKYLAKIASDLEKPDALVVVDPDRVQEFLDPLPVRRVWGVGRVTGEQLEASGVQTIADLRRLDREELERQLGKWGTRLWFLARGLDDRPVVPDREAKSISHETTFPEDVHSLDELRSWGLNLTEQVAARLRRNGIVGRTVSVKVRFHDFETVTRSVTLPEETNVTKTIWTAAAKLLEDRLPSPRPPVRLLGVAVTSLSVEKPRQRTLFDDDEPGDETGIDSTLDDIRQKFGRSSLTRGSDLDRRASD